MDFPLAAAAAAAATELAAGRATAATRYMRWTAHWAVHLVVSQTVFLPSLHANRPYSLRDAPPEQDRDYFY